MILSDEIKKEHITYINGGSSSNVNLSKLKYEFNSFIQFVEVNGLCIEHYEQFKKVVDVYFETLLICLDNSNYPVKNDLFGFGQTSSTINQIDKSDLENIIPHLNSKMLPTYLKEYSKSKVIISANSYEYIIDKLKELIKERKGSDIQNTFLINNFISFLKIANITTVNEIVDLIDIYGVLPSNSNSIEILLKIVIENYKNLTEEFKHKLFKEITNNIEIIISKEYTTHFNNFIFYKRILELLRLDKIDVEMHSNYVSNSLLIIENVDEKISEIEKLKEYLVNFYDYLDEENSEHLDKIFRKYISQKNINYYFVMDLTLAGSNNFKSKKNDIFNFLISEINEKENASVKSYPDKKEMAIAYLFDLSQKKYFSMNQITKADIGNKIKGKFPEIDWVLFNDRSDKTIAGLLTNRSFINAKEIFCKNNNDRKLFDSWVIRQVEDNKIKL